MYILDFFNESLKSFLEGVEIGSETDVWEAEAMTALSLFPLDRQRLLSNLPILTLKTSEDNLTELRLKSGQKLGLLLT